MLPGGLRRPVPHHRHRLTETCVTEATAPGRADPGSRRRWRNQPVRPERHFRLRPTRLELKRTSRWDPRNRLPTVATPGDPSSSNRAQPTRSSPGLLGLSVLLSEEIFSIERSACWHNSRLRLAAVGCFWFGIVEQR